MLIVLCYKYLIMHVHIVQSDFHVRHILFRGITACTPPFPISWSPPPLVQIPPAGGWLLWGLGARSSDQLPRYATPPPLEDSPSQNPAMQPLKMIAIEF